MDFTFSDEQQAIIDLTHRIASELLPPARLRELEQADWYADDVWVELAKADLLGLSLPEADGGGGYGLLEACLVAEQLGRAVAPVPYLACILGAAPAVARFGTEAQRAEHLAGVIDGSRVLTVALHEPGSVAVPDELATTATREGDGWRLDGDKAFVPAAERAAAVLVPARLEDGGVAVFLVAPEGPGVALTPGWAVTGEPQASIALRGAAVADAARLGGPEVDGAEVVAWMANRVLAGICAMQTGVCEEALAITSRYVSEREQFGTKLGTFQAVGHRVADAYIDTEAIRLTALQAIWRLDRGLDATAELMVAKFWAAEGAQRVVHAAQHLHGGIGVDLDYPIHRYFRWAKVLELQLGGASPSLLRLGARLADQPVGSS